VTRSEGDQEAIRKRITELYAAIREQKAKLKAIIEQSRQVREAANAAAEARPKKTGAIAPRHTNARRPETPLYGRR
jgi:hypothetical protein